MGQLKVSASAKLTNQLAHMRQLESASALMDMSGALSSHP
jgi:hypothetical protein